MKHWVGEWKEGKSWNNSMKSEGWAFLWARKSSWRRWQSREERDFYIKQKFYIFYSKWMGETGQRSTALALQENTRSKCKKKKKKKSPQPKQTIQWDECIGNFCVSETCTCLRVTVILKVTMLSCHITRMFLAHLFCPQTQTKLLYKYI